MQGPAFAGGMGLVSACDIAIASTEASFCLSEVKLGLIPAMISPYVIRAMGEQYARRYFLTGEVFDAAEAWRIGFVHELVQPEDLDATVNTIVGHLLAGGPQGPRRVQAAGPATWPAARSTTRSQTTPPGASPASAPPTRRRKASPPSSRSAGPPGPRPGRPTENDVPETQMFDKILIANRGEIACRVAATARRLGIRTVAVYSDADARCAHVRPGRRGVPHRPGAGRASPTCAATRIIAVARRTGAQAIHPGYGFLSENDAFAEACAETGMVFIGPPAVGDRAPWAASRPRRR